MNAHSLLVWGVLAGFSLLGVGCGGPEPQGKVSGEVNFNGKPVPAGMMRFEPSSGAGVPRNAAVRDGQFEATLEPGDYLVRITAGDLEKMGPPPEDPHAPAPDFVPLLPQPWNSQSKLVIKVEPGENQFNFRGDKAGEPSVEAATMANSP